MFSILAKEIQQSFINNQKILIMPYDYEDFIILQGEYIDEDDYLYIIDPMEIAKETKLNNDE